MQAQDGRVTRLEAQAGRFQGDVGTRFIDDADHPQRHAHLADLDAARSSAQAVDLAHRIGQRRDLMKPFDHRLQARLIQRQAIEQRGIEAVFATTLEVTGIRRQDCLAGLVQALGHGQQGTVLGRGIGATQLSGGATRLLPQLLHVGINVGDGAIGVGGVSSHAVECLQEEGHRHQAKPRTRIKAGRSPY
jgi:hypothetical protein